VAQRIPHVVDGVIHVAGLRGDPKIEVDSASWVAWLTDPVTRSFSFRNSSATYTARKERRSRGGEYWTAYRRQGGRLRKAYLGKAEDLTLDRLHNAAVVLESSDDIPGDPSPDTTVCDARSLRTDSAATAGAAATNDDAQQRPRQGTSGDPLLLTKLSIPSTRPSLVPRLRLSERLEEGLERKLTLVSAPAGFGKSTLLSSWISELSDDGRPVAWLSLDPADNDPGRFWRYFVTAVDQIQPGSGETALALLGSPQAPPIETILTIILNELGDLSVDAVLALDDYHLIESQAIHEALAFLIEHLPPRMHLVIATRADPPLPLSKVRARGELNELRASDLRFTSEEAATFLKGVMGLQLSAEHMPEPLRRVAGGWVLSGPRNTGRIRRRLAGAPPRDLVPVGPQDVAQNRPTETVSHPEHQARVDSQLAVGRVGHEYQEDAEHPDRERQRLPARQRPAL